MRGDKFSYRYSQNTLKHERRAPSVHVGSGEVFGNIVSSAKGLCSSRWGHRVEPLWQPISDKLEIQHHHASPERSQPLLLIGLFWCPTRWTRRPESTPLAEPSICADFNDVELSWSVRGEGEAIPSPPRSPTSAIQSLQGNRHPTFSSSHRHWSVVAKPDATFSAAHCCRREVSII